jgi:hypothetical protein
LLRAVVRILTPLTARRHRWNQTVLGFFAWAIERGFLNVVYVNRLLVNHTHIDVDQVFAILDGLMYGTTSRKQTVVANSPDAMARTMEYKLKSTRNGSAVTVQTLASAWEWDAWLDVEAIEGHGHRVGGDPWVKSADVHCCRLRLYDPTETTGHPDHVGRPRIAVVEFRSRNYGDAEFQSPIILLPSPLNTTPPKVASLFHTDPAKKAQAAVKLTGQVRTCLAWASHQATSGRVTEADVQSWKAYQDTLGTLVAAPTSELPTPYDGWPADLVNMSASDRYPPRVALTSSLQSAAAGAAMDYAVMLPDPEHGSVDVRVVGAAKPDREEYADRRGVKPGDFVLVRAPVTGPGGGTDVAAAAAFFAIVRGVPGAAPQPPVTGGPSPAPPPAPPRVRFVIGAAWNHACGLAWLELLLPVGMIAPTADTASLATLAHDQVALVGCGVTVQVRGSDIDVCNFGVLPQRSAFSARDQQRVFTVNTRASAQYKRVWRDAAGAAWVPRESGRVYKRARVGD